MGEESSRLEAMQHAPVQGENAVLSTMGGAIIRKYVYHEQKPINLLKNLERYDVQVNKNGRVQAFDPQNLEQAKNWEKDVEIGIHQNVMVTSGYADPYANANKDERSKYLVDNNIVAKNRSPLFVFNNYIRPDSSIRISQVFTAALDLQHEPLKNAGYNYDLVAQRILHAMYAGALLAAAQLKTKRLFLTFVGTGAFGNKIAWVLNALNTDLIKEVIASTGMEVILVIYPDLRKGRGIDAPEKHESMMFGASDLDNKDKTVPNSLQIQLWADLMNKAIQELDKLVLAQLAQALQKIA